MAVNTRGSVLDRNGMYEDRLDRTPDYSSSLGPDADSNGKMGPHSRAYGRTGTDNHGPSPKEGPATAMRRNGPMQADFDVADPRIEATNNADAEEMEALKKENAELRRKISGLERLVTEAASKAQYWAEQYRDYVRLLEEKSDVIRELHLKIQELQARPPVEVPTDEEILALRDELEAERRQLREDEAALMSQMRDMEVQMSRERAELARQRSELQRLHNEVRHELELATREASLRERLQPFVRRQQEMLRPGSSEPAPKPTPSDDPQSNAPTPEQAPRRSGQSGLFRRLFG